MPHVNHHGVDLDHTAHEIVKKHGLSSSCVDKIVDLLVQLQLVQVRLQASFVALISLAAFIATCAALVSSVTLHRWGQRMSENVYR